MHKDEASFPFACDVVKHDVAPLKRDNQEFPCKGSIDLGNSTCG